MQSFVSPLKFEWIPGVININEEGLIDLIYAIRLHISIIKSEDKLGKPFPVRVTSSPPSTEPYDGVGLLIWKAKCIEGALELYEIKPIP